MNKILVYGSRVLGRVVKDLIGQCDKDFVGFVDDYTTGPEIVGTFDEVRKAYPPTEYGMVIAIGYNDLAARWQIFQKAEVAGYQITSLIHPRAYVRDSNLVGRGALIMAGAVIDVNVRLAELVVVWPGVVVNHDSQIGANSFLSPNATVCGCVTIGANCFVGAGATIVDHRTLSSHSFVKAGALFTGK